MKVLVIKTSSLGDIIHTLPALTDATKAIPGIRFDWVVEEAFVEIPASHPAVDCVIPIAMRRWRKEWFKSWSSGEIRAFLRVLKKQQYDLIIDAQGLLFKSALVAMHAHGPRMGYDRASARDSWVAWTYNRCCSVSRKQHAIARVRQLFALALSYPSPDTLPDFGIKKTVPSKTGDSPYLIFLPGTTWPSKHWPEAYWIALAQLAEAEGHEVRLPWGNEEEKQYAQRLAADCSNVHLLPQMGLSELATELTHAAGIVGLDSGPSHLAAALGVPGVTLYGATHTDLTGVVGPLFQNLAADFPCAPCLKRVCTFNAESKISPACYQSLPPALVWARLKEQMAI